MTETEIAPDPEVLLAEMPDGTGVLLHLETRFYYTLNATGVFVWKAIGDEACRTPTAIAARLSERFEVSADVAARDIAILFDELATHGLVERKHA